jgi:hypothetical protein
VINLADVDLDLEPSHLLAQPLQREASHPCAGFEFSHLRNR